VHMMAIIRCAVSESAGYIHGISTRTGLIDPQRRKITEGSDE